MPDDATYGEKQFVSLNRAYTAIQPSANLKKTSVEQMRAAVRKACCAACQSIGCFLARLVASANETLCGVAAVGEQR